MSIFNESVDESLDRILREKHLQMFFADLSEPERAALEYRRQIYSERISPYYTQLEKLVRLENQCEHDVPTFNRLYERSYNMLTWIFMDKHINKVHRLGKIVPDYYTGEPRQEYIDETVRRLVNRQIEKENEVTRKGFTQALESLQDQEI